MQVEHLRLRRKKLLKEIDGGVAVIFAACQELRNFDVHHPLRQDSNFRYLTGLHDEPEAVLVLCSRNKEMESILFVRPKNPHLEMWEGRRPGPEEAKELTGVDCVHSLEDLNRVLPQLIPGHECLYFNINSRRYRDRLAPLMLPPPKERRRRVTRPEKMENIIPILGRLRLSKSEEEVVQMKRAADISTLAHRSAMALANAGSSEAKVQAFMEYIMHREGAKSLAYPSIVASGTNALVLHYCENRASLNEGDLLLIDAGCEIQGYASDITRTFPIDGAFTGFQGEMYDAVLSGQKRAIKQSRPGQTLEDIHREAVTPIVEWLLSEKILSGERDTIIEEKKYKDYYVHSTGHWMGLDVHDQCPYQDKDHKPLKLVPGMAYTIEPGLYFPVDDTKVPEHYRGLGIRIEDDILITQKGCENLTEDAPKERADIEEACRQDWWDFIKG